MSAQTISFSAQQSAQVERVRQYSDLPAAFASLQLGVPRPVIVLIAGAAGVRQEHTHAIEQVVRVIAKVAQQAGAAVIDGGTQSGGMEAMGIARAQAGGAFPLIGVAAEGTVFLPGERPGKDQCALDPNHSHFILVPGLHWGNESIWINEVAARLSGGSSSVSVLVNGGEIGRNDVAISLAANRPVFIMKGTGRLADELAERPKASAIERVLKSTDPAGIEHILGDSLQ